jgi:hypothetical protein
MPAIDVLKQMRGMGYVDKPSEEKEEDATPDGNRLIKLTEEEAKALGDYKEGEQECLVRGSMAGDGMFRVLSVSPAQGSEEPGSMDDMLKAVMTRSQVTPSPS